MKLKEDQEAGKDVRLNLENVRRELRNLSLRLQPGDPSTFTTWLSARYVQLWRCVRNATKAEKSMTKTATNSSRFQNGVVSMRADADARH